MFIFFTVLEPTGLRSGCQESWVLVEGPLGDLQREGDLLTIYFHGMRGGNKGKGRR
jgi:hypothetical protein